MESQDDMDDPVVHEVDVYLSQSLASNLYVLQYPMRPSNMPLSDIEHTHAKVKPKLKIVEVGLARDVRSDNYCTSRGEQIAINASGGGNTLHSQQPYFESGIMDTQTLRSAPSSCDTNKYAVAVLRDDELHLTPVHAVVQMRPVFDYLDRADAKSKADAASKDKAAGDSSQDEEEEAEAVTIKFAPQESAEAKARRLASCDYLMKRVQDEPWCPLTYVSPVDQHIVDQEFQLLYAVHGGEKHQQFLSSASEYMDSILPKVDNNDVNKPNMPENMLTLQQLKQMPLADSVRVLLTNVKVMQFSKLMEMLPEGTDPVATLRALQQVAVMVQGCWVVKSEVLYPADSCSPHSGVPAEILIRGRDFVMWKFTHCKYIVRREIAVGLPSEDVKDILEQMSVLRSSKGWEFVFGYDREFVEKHPEVVQRQRLLWDSKFQTLSKLFKLPKDADKKAKEAEQMLLMQNLERPRRRRASSRSSPRKRTLSGRSMSDLSDWEGEASSDSHRHGAAMTHTTIDSSHPQPMEVCADDSSSSNHALKVQQSSLSNGDLHRQNLGDSDSRRDSNGETSYQSDPEVARELAETAREVLSKIPVVKFSILKQHYLMKRDLMPSTSILAHAVVNDRMLREALVAAGAVQVNKSLINSPDQDSLYVYVHQGDHLDQAREVLMSMLEFTNKVRSTNFITKVRETGGQYTDADLKKLIRELCESRNSLWYLKGTAPKS